MRSPSRSRRRRSTPCVDGCCGPMLSTMSVLSAAPPMPTVVSVAVVCVVGVMGTVSRTYAGWMETGTLDDAGAGQGGEREPQGGAQPVATDGESVAPDGEPVWIGLPPGLLRMRRML